VQSSSHTSSGSFGYSLDESVNTVWSLDGRDIDPEIHVMR
jgi:hypothetical protein